MIPGFGAPLMLLGTLLVGVPILIHILNRRRFVVQSFAALRFLRQAFEERRRRLRLESLLLLLLRCAIVLAAALAMALPFVSSDSPLALISSGPRDVTLIVDRSGSMARLADSGASLDDRVLDATRRRLRGLSDERGDAVTVIFMGGATTLAAPIRSSPSVALAALEGELPEPSGVADVIAAVRYVAERVRPGRPGRMDLEIFSDMQRLSWGELGPTFGELLASILDRDGGQLRLVPVGEDEAAQGSGNLGVEELSADESLLLAGEPAGYTAVVRNHSTTTRRGVEGRFFLDGELVRQVTLDVAAGQAAPVTARLRIDTPGPHHVVFALPDDELPFDDVRTLAIDVRAAVDVLLVDGDPAGADPLSGATGYLQLALDPGDVERGVRFRTEVRELAAFEQATADLGGFDAIVMANVGGMTEPAAAALAEVVRSGTPLLWFLGDRVDPRLYNERLGPSGLMPARVGPVMGDPAGTIGEDYVTLVLPDPPPPALALFGDPRLAVLLQVPVLAWRDLDPAPEARVLASFADALGHTRPAIVEGGLGRGRVVVVGTSADDSWSLLPRFPATWVPLVHELLASLTARDPAATNVPVGQSPDVAVLGVPITARLTLPSGAMQVIDRPRHERVGSRSLLALGGVPLEEPGAYELDVETAAGVTTVALAALPEAREGDLERIDAASLEPNLRGIDLVLGEEPAEADAGDTGGDGSLATSLLWSLLVLVLAESLLARWMGKQR